MSEPWNTQLHGHNTEALHVEVESLSKGPNCL